MARQATSPVMFGRSMRSDTFVTMSSGRAAEVICCGYIPLLRGDSASGRVGIDIDLAEMPKPLLNGVQANIQAWFVPKTAHPQFSGPDEFMHSYQGLPIKSLGAADRMPPDFFHVIDGASVATVKASKFFKTLGIHIPSGASVNSDLIDAFNLVYNFRLAAHSSRLERKKYAAEDLAEALAYPPAFWPTGRFSRVVPDYERALLLGPLDFDVAAGQVPVSGIGVRSGVAAVNKAWTNDGTTESGNGFAGSDLNARAIGSTSTAIYAELAGEISAGYTLADLDKARTTQAFAKLRAAYAGNDATGFDNDDAIVATLMQGFEVPPEQFKRPWLLDSARVLFGFDERYATDSGNLDKSVSQGRASATLSLNVPTVDSGGIIIFTLEVLPERLDERASDEWVQILAQSQLPDALRDIQRPEPVDIVRKGRLDALHTDPLGMYGFEPMNDVWNRSGTRLGGVFYQADPANPFKEARSGIWQTSIVDPEFTSDHYLAPADFPHDVFSDTTAPAFEFVCRHSVAISGLTQIGDMLVENNDDYDEVAGERADNADLDDFPENE